MADALARDEVVRITRDLIRIDTTNDGTDDTVGEALAAEYVESCLREAGFEPQRFETTSARRQGVVLRVAGESSDRPALLLHGHLDVVPADRAQWTVDPFGAELHDGMIWGRGAVDMKDTDAMILAVLRSWNRTGARPKRDIVVLFTPDEEAGSRHGAHFLVDEHPDFFHGITEAVGEVGGFSITIAEQRRAYLIQTAEKGIAWLRLIARGNAGHGSLIHDDTAVGRLSRAIAAIAEHRFPVRFGDTTRTLTRELLDLVGSDIDVDADPEGAAAALASVIGPLGNASLRHTANPTVLRAGYKTNVVPELAIAEVDGRFLPGLETEFMDTIRTLVGEGIEIETLHGDIAYESDPHARLVSTMSAALQAHDPGSIALPYMIPAGTDAKAFARLGIAGYGFAPLRLPADLNFAAMFHGVDERVPVDALEFGVDVLDDFLRNA